MASVAVFNGGITSVARVAISISCKNKAQTTGLTTDRLNDIVTMESAHPTASIEMQMLRTAELEM
jgi:hypothetical protein